MKVLANPPFDVGLDYPMCNMFHIPDATCKSPRACQHPPCHKGPSIGFDITRTSGPDEPFRGACEEHLPLYERKS